jgi:Uma2 family endonuclease
MFTDRAAKSLLPFCPPRPEWDIMIMEKGAVTMSAATAVTDRMPNTATENPTPATTPFTTLAEYFALERASDVRHEYVDGQIRAMAGESPQHNRIAGNVYLRLEVAFGDRPCVAYFEGVRLRVTPTQYRYPDVMAVCGNTQFDNENPPALLNPSVIIEVLSPSTQNFDREAKFLEYRQIDGLTDYVLAAQDSILVIHFARQSATQWLVTEHTHLDDTLTFASLDVSLTLADIYRKVDFTVSPTRTSDESDIPTS